jgi:hypothetical protein
MSSLRQDAKTTPRHRGQHYIQELYIVVLEENAA